MSAKIVTAFRTLEDKFILNSLGAKVKYLFRKDSSFSMANNASSHVFRDWVSTLETPPLKIFCPLGVGDNPNHISVRNSAIHQWFKWDRLPKLYFYEDLPYAAKLEQNGEIEESEATKMKELNSYGLIAERKTLLLSKAQLARKAVFCKLYTSQTDYSSLLMQYAKMKGKETVTGFAEICFEAS